MPEWVCEICTLINFEIAKECDACSTSRSIATKVNDGASSPDNDSGSDESSADDLYDMARAHFDSFATQIDNGHFRCNTDGKVTRTRPLMTGYLVKYHSKLLNALRNPATSSSDLINNTFEVFETDEEIALRLAMDDYDNVVSQPILQQKTSLKRGKKSAALNSLLNIQSPQNNTDRSPVIHSKLITGHSTKASLRYNDDVDDDDDDVENSVEISDDFWKQERLKKLLSKTDRIVNNLTKMIRNVIVTSSNAEVDSVGAVTSIIGHGSPRAAIALLDPGIILRDYQTVGIEWLASLHANGLNGE